MQAPQPEKEQADQATFKSMGCASSQKLPVMSRPLKPVKAFKPIPDCYETLGKSSTLLISLSGSVFMKFARLFRGSAT